MSKTAKRLDEIMGMSFGDQMHEANVVLVNLHVRTTRPDGTLHEGTRPPLFMDVAVLEQVYSQLPGVLELMAEAGLDKDLLPPPSQPIPAWDAGPSLGLLTQPAMCSAFGFRPPDESTEGMVAVIGISAVGQGAAGEAMADYLVSHRTLLALQESIGKALARFRDGRKLN